MSNSKIIRDLNSGNVAATMISFALPLMLSSLLQVCYNTADMIIVGHFIGKNGLGAVSIGGDVLHFLCFIAMGFSNAGQVIIAQFVGAGMRDKAGRTIGTLFTFLASAAILFGAVGLTLHREILGWVNTPDEALEYTDSYVTVCLCGLIFIYGYNSVSAVLRGMGDSRHPLIFVAVAVGLNIVLDLCFVVWLKLAVFGVALATVISQAAGFLLALFFLHRHREQLHLDFRIRSFRIDPEILPPLLKLGVPMLIQSASISFSMLFVNSWINTYGVLAAAMTGIGNKLGHVVNIINIALGAAGSSMVGQAVGGERYERVPKILLTGLSISGAMSLAMGVTVVAFPDAVFGIFTSDAEVLRLALTYVPVALILFAGSALRPPMSALINGSGNFKLNLAVAMLDGVVMRIGLSLLLGLTFGFAVYGFWYGAALAGLTPFFIGGAYFVSGRWRTRKYIIRS